MCDIFFLPKHAFPTADVKVWIGHTGNLLWQAITLILFALAMLLHQQIYLFIIKYLRNVLSSARFQGTP